MTLYAGEKPEICHWAQDYQGAQLTDVGFTVTVTIWDLDGETVLIDEEPMEYDETLTSTDATPQVGGWFYVWASPAGAPGAYRARCTVVEMQAWEYKTIRLRRDKAPA